MATRQEANALCRTHLSHFIRKAWAEQNPGTPLDWNWHIEVMAYNLEQCWLGNTKRLLITVPPRNLKSFCATVVAPAWFLGHDPTLKILTACYGQELTDELTRQFRDIVESDWYREIFPGTIIRSDHNRRGIQVTTEGGFRRATSVGGPLTGTGCDIAIVDDPLKAEDALSAPRREEVQTWFSNTLVSRLNDPENGVIIGVMQRTHMDDFVGYVTGLSDWTQVNIPAIETAETEYRYGDDPEDVYVREVGELIQPSRMSMERLEEQKLMMGEHHFEAQYQQNPLPAEGALIRREWFKTIPDLGPDFRYDTIIHSLDTATDEGEYNDYTAITIWGVRQDNFDLLHVERRKMQYPDLYETSVDLINTWGADFVLVEKASSGIQLFQDLRRRLGTKVRSVTPRTSKLLRMDTQSVFLRMGQVHLPEDAYWLGDFLSEVLSFPNSAHDDQVDSLSQFLQYMRSKGLLRLPEGADPDRNHRGNGPGSRGERRPGSASRREMSRRNFKRRQGTPIPGGSSSDDDDRFIPTLVAGGV